MDRKITQRELRNESGRIMRALDRGKYFIITRNGVPVGELIPLRQRMFVPAKAAVAAFAGAPVWTSRGFGRISTPPSTKIPLLVADKYHARGLVDTSVVIDL